MISLNERLPMVDQLPVVCLNVPVQLYKCLVTVRTHFLQRFPLVDPFYVDSEIKPGARFIVALITLEIFDLLMDNFEMAH